MADKTEFLQAIDDAILDADSLERFINGDDTQDVLTRLSAKYPTLQKAIKELFENGGIAGRFKTLAELDASSLVDGDYALVADDEDEKNGIYIKEGGTWVKTSYDPLTKSKDYTNTKHSEAISSLTNYTDSEISKIAEISDAGELAAALTDADDNVLAYIKNDATVFANDFVTQEGSLNSLFGGGSGGGSGSGSGEFIDTSLAQAFTDESGTVLWGLTNEAEIVSSYPPVQGLGIDAIRSQLLDNDSLNRAGAYIDRMSSKHLEPMFFEVMVAADGSDGLTLNRMGSMHQLSDNRFYVCWTQYNQRGTDQYGGRLSAKFMDVDFKNKTATLSDTIEVYNGFDAGENAPSQPHFFKVKDGVILISNINDDLVTYKSTDGCESWEEVARYDPSPSTFWLALDGIVRIEGGLYNGRLVAVGFAWKTPETSQNLKSMYSDDDGITWQEGFDYDPVVEFGWSDRMSEMGVATDTEHNLIFVIRNDDNGSHGTDTSILYWGKSTDGGLTFTPFEQLEDTFASNCQTGIVQVAPNAWQGVPKILITGVTHTPRKGLEIRLSYDNCMSWAKRYQLIPKEVTTGYTSIKVVNPHTYGVVYEYGGFNATSNLAVKFINLAEIYK